MEIDPFDERDLYNRPRSRNDVVSRTISTIVVHGGPLQLVIALLRVRSSLFFCFQGVSTALLCTRNQQLLSFNIFYIYEC